MITNVDEWQRLYEVIAADLQTSECKNVLVLCPALTSTRSPLRAP